MSCNVTTGYSLSASASASSGTCLVATPGKVILFSPETLAGTDRSIPFTITPGNAALIDAYNLTADYHVYLNKAIYTSTCKVQGCACDPKSISGISTPVRMYGERMTLGGNPENWSLIKYSDESKVSRLQLLIAIPGTFELELEDPDAQLGNMEIEMQVFPIKELHLPDNYFGGI